MSIRKDKVQLEVEINGQKVVATYKQMTDKARDLNRELKNLTPGTEDFIKKSAELKDVNSRIAAIRETTKGVNNELGGLPGVLSKIGVSMKTFTLAGIITGVVQLGKAIVGLGSDALKSFDEAAKADAQLRAGIISTGGAAGRSFSELNKQASDLQEKTLFSDDATKAAQGVLLTFTKVREEIFDRSIPAIQDYATRMGTDLTSATVQVGKALNDPIKGVTALSKAGVQFSVSQRETIKSMVETNNLAGAQNIILTELETQFKGSAEAAANAGLGPFQKFQNRLDDVNETIGELIANGLGFLKPIFDAIATGAESFANSLLSGERATGKFSAGINLTISILRTIGQVIGFVYDSSERVVTIIGAVIAAFLKLPVVSSVVEGVTFVLKNLYEGFIAIPQVIAGLRSAMKTAFENMVGYAKQLLYTIQILGKEIELGITIRPEARAKIKAEISSLEALKTQASAAGKNIGEAFWLGVAEFNKTKKVKDDVKQSFKPPIEDGTGGGGSAKDVKSKKERKYIEVEQLKGKKSIQEEFKGFLEQQKQREKAAEAAKKYSDKVLKERIDAIQSETQAQLDAEQLAFITKLSTEEEYEKARLQIIIDAKAKELEVLEALSLADSEQYRKALLQKEQAQREFNDKQITQEERTAQIVAAINKNKTEYARNAIDIGIQLLSKDEQARKKNASAIKAFETANVLVNLASEISGIFKGYSKIPFLGKVLAFVEAGLATGRAYGNIRKINAQKFALSGKVLPLSAGRIDADPNIPTQKNGDNVLATVKPGEVILNEQHQAAIGGDRVFKAIGVPGFGGGGIIATKPQNIQGLGGFADIMSAANIMMEAALSLKNTRIKAKVVHTELQEVSEEIDYIKKLSQA